MNLTKKNSNSKKWLLILQLLAMSFLFVILSDKQSIFFIKDFLRSLNVDSNLYSLLARGYAGIKLMFDLPSCFGICFFILQIICATYTFKCYVINLPYKVLVCEEKIKIQRDHVESVTFAQNYLYLENHKLLN